MRVSCPSCQTGFNIDERRIPPGGAKLKCSTCQTLIPLRPPEAAAPPPPRATGPSVGGVRLAEGAVPLPGLGLPAAGAPPLPKVTARAPEAPPVAESMTTGVIPLPPTRAFTPPTVTPAPAVPPANPSRRADRTVVATPATAPVRLPAPSARAAAPSPAPAAPPPDGPLPGVEEAWFDDAALSDAGAVADAPLATGADGWPGEETPDDGSYGAEPLHEDTPAETPEPDTPPQAAAAAQEFDIAAPWDAGRSPEFGTVDLGDDANATALPIPTDEPAPAASEVAWTEPAAAPDSLDLSNLPQTRALKELDGGPPADPLEFDPTRAAPEDLEADLSKPLPAGVGPAEDGLEVLGFLDEAAKEIRPRAGRVTRYHVRRRSGKVFGPFEPGVIVKMLEDGQLLGSEEVSTDGEAWTGLAGVPTFAQAMQRLVSAPSPAAPPVVAATRAPAAPPPEARPRLDMDQLAQAYGGRMAVVSVVDGEAQARRRKKMLLVAAAALGVLALIGAGASLQMTRYGAFGLRWLFPAHLSASSAEGKAFAAARASLAEDTWPGARRAQGTLEGLLAGTEYPEVRAVWAQCIFLEQRRWSSAEPSALAKARASLEDLTVLPRGNPERLRAEIGRALVDKQPDAAITMIKSAKLDDGPLLEAEALLQKALAGDAALLLEGAVKASPSAAGFHALGLAHLKLKKPDRAQADFEAALKLAPQHLSSTVELAQLAWARKDAKAVIAGLEPALADPKALAPPERTRGLALRGAALLALGKPADAVAGLEEAVKIDPGSIFAKGTLARAYAAIKEDEKALPLWKAAVAGEPDDPVWAAGQVQSLAALRKSEEALAAATKARAAFPKDEATVMVIARAQELLDRVTDAEDSYKLATQLDPKDLDAALGLARLYVRQRRPDDARAALVRVEEQQSQNARLRLGLGELALVTGDLNGAQTEFERATTLAPQMPEAWVARARLEIERHAWKDARAHVEKGLALDPDVPDGRLVHGLALWKLGELEGAAKELEAARSAGPNSRLEVALAAVRFEQGDSDTATALLTAVLKAEPGNPEANFWMSRVHDKKGNYSLALESIRAALDRAPTRAAYHHELGLILKDSGKSPEAVEAWRQAVKLDPGYADAWEAMGDAFLDANRVKDAIPAFEAALKADPGRSRVLGKIGDAHFQAAKWTQAIASYQSALKVDPKLTGLYYRLGRAYSELGQYDKAIGFYQRALSATPDNAQAWYHLGYAWKERGRKKEAVNAFQQYLAKAPDAKDKKDIEDEIYYLSK